MASPAGELLGRAFDLEFGLEAGFTITLADVTSEEYEALRALKAERAKYTEEKDKLRQWRDQAQSLARHGSR